MTNHILYFADLVHSADIPLGGFNTYKFNWIKRLGLGNILK